MGVATAYREPRVFDTRKVGAVDAVELALAGEWVECDEEVLEEALHAEQTGYGQIFLERGFNRERGTREEQTYRVYPNLEFAADPGSQLFPAVARVQAK